MYMLRFVVNVNTFDVFLLFLQEPRLYFCTVKFILNILIMRHLIFIAVTFCITQEFIAQNNNYSLSQEIENGNSIVETDHESDWEKVQITSNKSILEQLIPGERFVVKHKVYGKNIENSSKAENEAIIKLKKLAYLEGYPIVAIEKIYSKASGVPKRRYRIVKITALGYKDKN